MVHFCDVCKGNLSALRLMLYHSEVFWKWPWKSKQCINNRQWQGYIPWQVSITSELSVKLGWPCNHYFRITCENYCYPYFTDENIEVQKREFYKLSLQILPVLLVLALLSSPPWGLFRAWKRSELLEHLFIVFHHIYSLY